MPLDRVCVLIPVYNRAQFLPEAVQSVLANGDDVALDVLIIDDGSTDETPQVIAKLCADDRRVRAVRRDNGGVAAARNTGLLHVPAGCDFVTFLDSDDVMMPQRFRADLAVFKAPCNGEPLQFTYGRTQMVEIGATALTAFDPPPVSGIHLSMGLYRRALLERVGCFDESLCQAEDTDFLLRLCELGVPYRLTETLCFRYRRHADNMTHDRDAAKTQFAHALIKRVQRLRAEPERAGHPVIFATSLKARGGSRQGGV